MEIENLLRLKQYKDIAEFLNSLNGEKLKEYLIAINSQVRSISIEDEEAGLFQPNGYYCTDGTYKQQYMRVDTLIAPKKETQDKYFDKMADFLKNTDIDRRSKAVVMYYLINYLHLFKDGNGRTSRIVYDLISGTEISEKDQKEYYKHKDDSNIGNRNSFYDERNITNVKIVGDCASYFLLRYLIDEGLIDNSKEDLKKHIQIKTYETDSPPDIDQAKEKLSKKDIFYLQRAITDNNESISSAALAILMMLTKKNNMKPLKVFQHQGKEWDARGLIRNGINISKGGYEDDLIIRSKDSSIGNTSTERALEAWKAEDFLCVIELVDKLKECILDLILDFAERPESFKFNKDGKNMIEMMTQGTIELHDFEAIASIYEAPFEIDEGSRMHTNIEELKRILNKIREIKIQDVENLGEQTADISVEKKDSVECAIGRVEANEQEKRNGGGTIWQ